MFRKEKNKSSAFPAGSDAGLFAWVGNLAIFYLILLALVTIPFLILIIILSIRAALEHQVWIFAGVFVLLIGTVFLLIQRKKQIQKRFDKGKEDVMEVIHTAAREGHNVNISFLHGLIRLDYQSSTNDGRLLQGPILDQLKALPMQSDLHEPAEVMVTDPQDSARVRSLSTAVELEKLAALLDRGVLTEAEFHVLKERLFKDKDGQFSAGASRK